ncbi:MAG: type II toxin-antitoxin system HicB family antitoxin [Gammaproteobacteria bacterium WSBS_2016_MAG_OTU1]
MTKELIEIKKGADTISIHVRLRAFVKKEKPGMYVSYCPALDVYSQGKTIAEAKKNIIEATTLFIESCFEGGTLSDVLHESGFRLSGEKMPRKQQKSMGDFEHGREIRIPAKIPFLAYC